MCNALSHLSRRGISTTRCRIYSDALTNVRYHYEYKTKRRTNEDRFGHALKKAVMAPLAYYIIAYACVNRREVYHQVCFTTTLQATRGTYDTEKVKEQVSNRVTYTWAQFHEKLHA